MPQKQSGLDLFASRVLVPLVYFSLFINVLRYLSIVLTTAVVGRELYQYHDHENPLTRHSAQATNLILMANAGREVLGLYRIYSAYCKENERIQARQEKEMKSSLQVKMKKY